MLKQAVDFAVRIGLIQAAASTFLNGLIQEVAFAFRSGFI